MVNQSANFYGILLLLLMFVTIIGIMKSEPATTGFVVRDSSFFDVKTVEDDPRVCADASQNGECSTILKPKFCVYGTLVDYCELCGCDEGEVCSNHECVRE